MTKAVLGVHDQKSTLFMLVGSQLLGWFDAGQQPNTDTAAHSFQSPVRHRGNRKAKRLLHQDSDSLIGEAEAVHASKAKRAIHSLPTGSRQIPKRFPGNRASACERAAWEDKRHNHKCPPLFLLSLSFYWWEGLYTGWNISLVSLGQLSWLGALLRSCPPWVYCLGGQSRNEKALKLCKDCSAMAKILLCNQHCFSHNFEKQHCMCCCEGR